MHGALSTEKLELHAIQLWGGIRGNLTVIEPENQTSCNRGVSDLYENQVKDSY